LLFDRRFGTKCCTQRATLFQLKPLTHSLPGG
jgi:hypothetical protein